jgi:hypothetical protein
MPLTRGHAPDHAPIPASVREQIVRLLRAYRPGLTTAVVLLGDGGVIPETLMLTRPGAALPAVGPTAPASERTPRTALRVWDPGPP